jgi:KTSC domain-containing protein
MVTMTPVESSNIAAVGYDAETQTLTVEFRNGSKHAYTSVPPETHHALMLADSKGKYFHTNIRNAFASTKVS